MPKVILSPLPFIGQSQRSQMQGLTYAVGLAQPRALTQLLPAAAAAGADGCFCFYSDDLVAALRRTKQQSPQWTIYPVVPNMTEYSRAVNQYGMVGAGIRLLKRSGPISLVRLGLFAMPKGAKAIKRDMRALLPILVHIEMMVFARFRPPAILLHAGITDLALANNNADMIHSFTRLVRRSYNARPGLMTQNLGRALVWIRSEELDVEVVAGPANAKDRMIQSTQRDFEQAIADWKGQLIAVDPLCGRSLAVADGLTYVTKHRFDGFTVEVGGLDDLEFLAQVVAWVRRS